MTRRPSPRSPSTNVSTPAPTRARSSTAQPLTVDDVLGSPMIADPIHMLETVMRVQGGTGVLIANADIARQGRHRPVWITGFGEHIAFKTPTYADDLVHTPIARAAEKHSRWRG